MRVFSLIDANLLFSLIPLHIAHHYAVTLFQSADDFHVIIVAVAEVDGARHEGVLVFIDE